MRIDDARHIFPEIVPMPQSLTGRPLVAPDGVADTCQTLTGASDVLVGAANSIETALTLTGLGHNITVNR